MATDSEPHCWFHVCVDNSLNEDRSLDLFFFLFWICFLLFFLFLNNLSSGFLISATAIQIRYCFKRRLLVL